jgi:hypothetical protein
VNEAQGTGQDGRIGTRPLCDTPCDLAEKHLPGPPRTMHVAGPERTKAWADVINLAEKLGMTPDDVKRKIEGIEGRE